METKEVTKIKTRKPSRRYNINKKTLAKAIIQNNGLISKIAKQINAPIPTVKNMIDKDKSLQTIINSTKEIVIDEAESQLYKKIKQGNWQAIKYLLDKQAEHRGYSEKQNVNVNHQVGIVIMPATMNNNQWEQSTKQNVQNPEVTEVTETAGAINIEPKETKEE